MGAHARQFVAGFVESYDAGQENDDSCRPGDDDLGKPAVDALSRRRGRGRRAGSVEESRDGAPCRGERHLSSL